MPTTPNMSLLLPIPTITPGPTYASENNDAFAVVDSHDHTTGKGVPVPSNGININNDLPFNGFNASSLRSTQFQSQNSPLSLPSDITNLYVANGNLYYNNQIGQQVQITSGASLNASTIGGIGGDYVGSGALEFYTSSTKTFTFWSSTNIPANLDAGSITIREVTTSPNGITISSPLSLAANYSMTLPTALPVSQSFVTLDNSGNITTPVAYPLPRTGQAAVGQQISASCGMFSTSSTSYVPVTNLNVSLTTSGRPVFVALQPDNSNGVGGSCVTIGPAGAAIQYGIINVYRDGSPITAVLTIPPLSSVSTTTFPLPGFLCLDTPSAGPHTYEIQMVNNAANTVGINFAVLVAFEL